MVFTLPKDKSNGLGDGDVLTEDNLDANFEAIEDMFNSFPTGGDNGDGGVTANAITFAMIGCEATATSLGTSDELLPTQNAVKTYVDVIGTAVEAKSDFTALAVGQTAIHTGSIGDPATFYDLDLSTIASIGANSRLVLLEIENNSTNTTQYCVKPKGWGGVFAKHNNGIYGFGACMVDFQEVGDFAYCIAMTDTAGKLEHGHTGAGSVDVKVVCVLG